MQKAMPCTLLGKCVLCQAGGAVWSQSSGPAAGSGGLFLENVAGRNPLFCSYEDIDWEASAGVEAAGLKGDELLMYQELRRRGASFLKFLTKYQRKAAPRKYC